MARLFAIAGLAAVIAGTAGAVDQLGTLEGFVEALVDWLPVVLIGFGMVRLLGIVEINWALMGPALLVVAGLLLQGVQKETISVSSLSDLIPGSLLILGSALILKASSRSRRIYAKPTIRTLALLGGGVARAVSDDLSNVRVYIILGRLDLDLRQSGPSATGTDIQCWVVFGQLRMFLPKDQTWLHRIRFSLPTMEEDSYADSQDPSIRIDEIRIYGQSLEVS